MHSCIVFVAVLAVVRTMDWSPMDLAYTKISFTTTGKPCLNDCKNNTCFTNHTLTPHACLPGNETAPIYRTAYHPWEEFTYLSGCGKYDYYYDWCIVFSNQPRRWAFCNPETKGHRTLHYGPCVDDCKMDDYFKDYMCARYAGMDPKEYSYIQAKTIFGDECNSECVFRKEESDYVCFIEKHGLRRCTLPGISPALRGFFNVPVQEIINCTNISKLNQTCNDIGKHNSNISALAEKLEEQDYLQTLSLNERRNPVYKYTVLALWNNGDPWLPLVIKANITSDTIRCSDNNEAEGKTELLIGALIGGFEDPYNIVPLSVTAEQNLRKYENQIYKMIIQDGSVHVTIIIVIMYDDTLKPFAFGLNYIFVKDGKVYKEIRNEIVYNNLSPETESLEL